MSIMTEPEFSVPVSLDRIGVTPETCTFSAPVEARLALAKRFDLLRLDQLDASVSVMRDGDQILMRGQFRAELAQACVASGETITASIKEPLLIRFIHSEYVEAASELELSEPDCDVMEWDGKIIDLGEAVAQSLGLALDPYPRSAGAADKLKAAGILQETDLSPFAALAALKKKL